MAHLWAMTESQSWAIVPLDEVCGRTLVFTGDRAAPLRRVEGLAPRDTGAVCLRAAGPDGEHWALLKGEGRPEVLVNGLPVFTGIRVLQDRDVIVVDGVHRFHFSAERQARVEAFPAASREIRCARCHQPIAPGSPAVRCPGGSCGYWHHEDPEHELTCWSGYETCALCSQSTCGCGPTWEPEWPEGESR